VRFPTGAITVFDAPQPFTYPYTAPNAINPAGTIVGQGGNNTFVRTADGATRDRPRGIDGYGARTAAAWVRDRGEAPVGKAYIAGVAGNLATKVSDDRP
jgi:hypothetical protein